MIVIVTDMTYIILASMYVKNLIYLSIMFQGMKSVDYIMADLLVGTWFALSSIVMLNLFIALMSDTFQR